jgi:hypothetical protein
MLANLGNGARDRSLTNTGALSEEVTMPVLLFWLPLIILIGTFEVADNDAREMTAATHDESDRDTGSLNS